ncbi:MAG: rod shape-determining protein MreC [Thermodesulfobacteriota bacterium]|nr:rod shape-determining protein MreC [Thermodesulfobacteriota bacterium]
MLSPSRNLRLTITAACLAIIAILVISLNAKEKDDPFFFETYIHEIFSPFQRVIQFTKNGFVHIWSSYIFLVNLNKENEQQKQTIKELKENNLQLRESHITNIRLRKLLHFKEKFKNPMVPAEVVGWDPSSWFNTILIDKGRKDGIEKNMPVVVSEGIVGRIMELSRSTSKVLLAIDHRSAIDAIVHRSRAKGILVGMVDQKCQLKYVIRADDVRVGDEIVSSGLGGIFPKGLLLGTVSKIKKDKIGMFQHVEVTPTVNFTKLEEVFLIIHEKPYRFSE